MSALIWMLSMSWPLYVFCHSSLMILLMSAILEAWKVSSAFSRACTQRTCELRQVAGLRTLRRGVADCWGQRDPQ